MSTKHRSAGLFPGLILVSLGGGLLARELGYLPEHVRPVDFWPLLVVFIGISSLTRSRGVLGAFFALAFVVMGGVLLAGNLGLIAFPAARLWPVLLVLLGVAVLLRGRRAPKFHWPHPEPPDGGSRPLPDGSNPRPPDGSSPSPPDWSTPGTHHWSKPGPYNAQTTASDRLEKQIMFSGAQLRIESQAWKGGWLGVTVGGVEIDLRYAKLDPAGALLDLRVLMGGVDIRVPDTWQVHCEATPLFGGVDDSTRPTQGATDAPRLRVVGAVTLGGVNIRN